MAAAEAAVAAETAAAAAATVTAAEITAAVAGAASEGDTRRLTLLVNYWAEKLPGAWLITNGESASSSGRLKPGAPPHIAANAHRWCGPPKIELGMEERAPGAGAEAGPRAGWRPRRAGAGAGEVAEAGAEAAAEAGARAGAGAGAGADAGARAGAGAEAEAAARAGAEAEAAAAPSSKRVHATDAAARMTVTELWPSTAPPEHGDAAAAGAAVQAGAYTRPHLSSTCAVSDTINHPIHPKHPLTPLQNGLHNPFAHPLSHTKRSSLS